MIDFYEKVLNTKIESHDFNDPITLKRYLQKLLTTLIDEEESFSGKRPFGNSGWLWDVYLALIKAGHIPGKLDEDGYIEEIETKDADNLINNCIEHLFK